ncbi:aldehyde dehydrogenase (NADP(+)) [Nocardioides sp. MH1]|uniref:aldehyde dehydrogenase (NADP(+)) n=1 Tax=Nocardioides sp. MH1 TaxID=3242490 RepID=UPI003521C3C9
MSTQPKIHLDPDLDQVLARAARAAAPYAATDPRARAGALVAVAERLDACADDLVALGEEETGLAEARLRGELARTTAQLRLFAEVVVEGSYLDVRIDAADPDFATGPRPDVRRLNVPLGPVLVFAASNFPLAFSVAGGDTAAALAAGCPVVVKAHEGHPRLSALVADVVRSTLAQHGMPEGTFAVVERLEDGAQALRDPRIRAAAFTGSTRVGQTLAEVAARRPVPIPFYGELGSLNPVVVTPSALAARPDQLAQEYVASASGSAGQLCTKPGFCLVPAVEPLAEAVAAAAAAVPPHRLLTPGISRAYRERRAALLADERFAVVAEGTVETDDRGLVSASPTVLAVALDDLRPTDVEETFGPLSVLVRYDDLDTVPGLLDRLFPGNLTAAVQTGPDDDGSTLAPLLATFSRVAGRVVVDGWPTGVAVTAAMQHGGPSPSTTTDATSVGTAAIGRFVRGVAFQSTPEALLPPALRDDNPWAVPQRRSPAGLSAGWGSLAGRY